MPCYDPEYSWASTKKELNKTEAMLCGLLRAVEAVGPLEILLRRVDWQEMGMSKEEFLSWWSQHQAKDRQRSDSRSKINPNDEVDFG
jgi:hypothetical protein